jgi:tRNA pseudouridine38-40 synthase
MTRIALGLEYDGTDFVGWQTQPGERSVQSVLERAVSSVADTATHVVGAGRTDAGVHAAGQVVHFDTAASRTERQWLFGINSNLPADVAVRWVRSVDTEFNARRSALRRRYRYLLVERGARPALARRNAWWMREPLDYGAMTAAASYWLGEHDFSAFRAAGCQSKTAMRYLYRVTVRHAAPFVAIEVTANAFLQHMVRNMVGVLVAIGRGREQQWAREVLASRDRTCGGVAAPPCGLSLVAVEYPERYDLPPAEPRAPWSHEFFC